MNTSNASNLDLIYRSGYDIPLYGLANGQLLNIHIPALVLISVSFICVLTVIGLSFCRQNWKTFFKWTRSKRFVVYLALCDGSFNVSHFTDHMHIVIAKRHVYPKALCEFYGFNLAVFVTAQILMVNAVAVNSSSCYFDGVKGTIANLLFTTVPLVLVLVMNTILYTLTWIRIHKETKRLHLGDHSQLMSANFTAARNMSLFVVAFFVQWWPAAVFGVWAYVSPISVPLLLFHFLTTFCNTGGILNLIVYIMIRRRLLLHQNAKKKTKAPHATEMSALSSSKSISL